MTRIVAVANQKGGVGKTTTAVNLAASLAAAEQQVLLVDLDPQANASSGLGVGPQPLEQSMYAALLDGTPMDSLLRSTDLPTLFLAPSGPDLYGAELELASLNDRFLRLESALRTLTRPFDVVLVDCPPSLGLLTLNALSAARSVLIPMQCEYFALEGLSQLSRTLELVRHGPNPDLDVEGVLLTMFDARNNLSKQVAADVRTHFPRQVYEAVIPRNVRLSEAPSHGKPVLLYDVASSGSQSYFQLADEFMSRTSARAA